MPKTGTSTIQGILFDNEAAVLKAGYVYSKGTMSGRSDFGYAHHNLGHAAALKLNGNIWKQLHEELAHDNKRRVVISNDGVSDKTGAVHLFWSTDSSSTVIRNLVRPEIVGIRANSPVVSLRECVHPDRRS